MYLDLIDCGLIPKSVYIWKIKVLLRIKIFMWFVHKRMILTKDNLLNRSWVGSSRCCFCDNDETIQNLFIDCPLDKLLWRTIHIAFNISPPVSINMLFGTSLIGVEPITAGRIRIGICAVLWNYCGTYSDRNCTNDMIFNRQNLMNFLQVIYRASAWISMWSFLTHTDCMELLATGCNRWETVAWAIYNRFGWRSNNRIDV